MTSRVIGGMISLFLGGDDFGLWSEGHIDSVTGTHIAVLIRCIIFFVCGVGLISLRDEAEEKGNG